MTLALWHIDPASGSLTSVTAEGGALVLPLRRVAPALAALLALGPPLRGMSTRDVYAPRPLAGPVAVWRDLTGRDYVNVPQEAPPLDGDPMLRVQHTASGGAWPPSPPGSQAVAFVVARFSVPSDRTRAGDSRMVSATFKHASGRGMGAPSVGSMHVGFGLRTLADAVTFDGCVVLFNPESNGDLSTPNKWIPALVADDPVQLGDASDAAALARVAA